jgi:hypothetical protein
MTSSPRAYMTRYQRGGRCFLNVCIQLSINRFRSAPGGGCAALGRGRVRCIVSAERRANRVWIGGRSSCAASLVSGVNPTECVSFVYRRERSSWAGASAYPAAARSGTFVRSPCRAVCDRSTSINEADDCATLAFPIIFRRGNRHLCAAVSLEDHVSAMPGGRSSKRDRDVYSSRCRSNVTAMLERPSPT